MTAEHLELRERLLFGTPHADFARASADVRVRLADEYREASPGRRGELVDLVVQLSIDLGSYLTRWHLRSPAWGHALDDSDMSAQIDQNRELLRDWHADAGLDEISRELASIEHSNLRRLSALTDEGVLNTRWGHDAATGLTAAVRRGAMMVTTNPVMVNTVRKDDPDTWDPVRDALRDAHPEASAEERVSLMTMRVVLEGCRELRPIWEASGGRYGYVSLQVNPRANDDAAGMADEVEDLFARLGEELGGTPNARFKIPATRAGLEAVARLTSQGIGVTVTVNASVDQQLAFAKVIEQGSAPLSFLVLMMGRLDDPVRDELAAAGVVHAVEASRWASVAVLRRAYALLFDELGYRRSAIMAASMRGPWTIDGAIVDGQAEMFITCFPDKAQDYDAVERPLVSHVYEPLPEGVEQQLMRSQTFRQAYTVGALAPDTFDTFVPVVQTLDQFARNYDEFVAYNR